MSLPKRKTKLMKYCFFIGSMFSYKTKLEACRSGNAI